MILAPRSVSISPSGPQNPPLFGFGQRFRLYLVPEAVDYPRYSNASKFVLNSYPGCIACGCHDLARPSRRQPFQSAPITHLRLLSSTLTSLF